MNELLVGYAPYQRSKKISPRNHERSRGRLGAVMGCPAAEIVVQVATMPTPGKVVVRVVEGRRVG